MPHDAQTMPDPPPLQLKEAFYLLCQAMAPHLLDNLPAYTHCQEIQAWMTDAGPDANGQAQAITAWRHAVALLEGILGQKLSAG
jgi:hypothetical protein